MLQKAHDIPLVKNHLLITDILAAEFRPMTPSDLQAFQGIEGYGQLADFRKDGVEYLLVSDTRDTPDYNRRLECGKIKVEVYCLEVETDTPQTPMQIFNIDINEVRE